MNDIERIRDCWTVPDNWIVEIVGDNMEVFDSERDHVITAMTQINIIEKINEHIETQQSWAAFKIIEATLKEPIEA
tara:strand:+ start:582 stop:809 length:228 start_codon:yes stop_codon:yes gene_type:complete